jgi:hypothetical protein
MVLSLFIVSRSAQNGTGQAIKLVRSVPAVNPPTFSDTFSAGTLDATKWFVDTGRAPGNIPGKNVGTLNPKNVDLATGMLRLTLTERFGWAGYFGGRGNSLEAAIRLWELRMGGARSLDLGHAQRRRLVGLRYRY